MNTPNKLTVARVIVVPFMVLFLLTGWGGEANRYISLILFAGASITDWFDGFLARKYKCESDFGRLMDPLADKIFIVATFVMFSDYRIIPAWIVVIVIAREFMVTGLRLLALSEGIVISADKSGKIKTALQMFALLIAGAGWINLFDIMDPVIWNLWYALILLVMFVTLYSGVSYFVKNYKLFRNKF